MGSFKGSMGNSSGSIFIQIFPKNCTHRLVRPYIPLWCFYPILRACHNCHTPIQCVRLLDAHPSDALAWEMDSGRGRSQEARGLPTRSGAWRASRLLLDSYFFHVWKTALPLARCEYLNVTTRLFLQQKPTTLACLYFRDGRGWSEIDNPNHCSCPGNY